MNAKANRYADSVCCSAIGDAPSSRPIAGKDGKYMSTENGPSMDSAARRVASDQDRRSALMANAGPLRRAALAAPGVDSPGCRQGFARERGIDGRAIQRRREQGDE